MKFIVYHVNEPNFLQDASPDFFPATMTGYSEVAVVDVASLEEVFHVTNHIDKPWWENSQVVSYKPNSRSTSVGDVVMAENGDVFRCMCSGWKKILSA